MRRRALAWLAAITATVVAVPVGVSTRAVALPAGLPLARPAAVAPVHPGVHVERHLFNFTPDDPYFTKQSSYLNAVHAPAAWSRQRGSSTVLIAIVDSGIDVNHPDLKSKIVGTYNAVDPTSRSITDTIGHGTFVAGVAAADTGNGVGVAGAGVNTRLLGVKVAGAGNTISISNEVAGIRWAADHHADVINLSLGGPNYNQSEARAVAYAQAKGALVVAAAGNAPSTEKQYPAAYPKVIAVAATDTSTRTRAGFSGHGSWVDVAAPGVGIVSTTPHQGSRFFGAGSYARSSGTSFAAPIVSAEAALLKAQNPSLSVGQLRADVIASAHGYQHLGLGAGQIDFNLGLDHVRPTSSPASLTASGTADSIPVRATSTAPAVRFRIDSGSWTAPVRVRNGAARTTLDTDGYPNGRHTLSAVDCTRFGECNPQATSSSIQLQSPAADITSPTHASDVTGLISIAAGRPAGGTLQLLVDGAPRGRPTAAPYRFDVSASTLIDGAHTLQVKLCSADGTRCDGPLSAPVTVVSTALYPGQPTLAAARISPNGDGIHDTATLSFSLPDPESVDVQVLDRTGVIIAESNLGSRAAGNGSWTWNGIGSDGAPLPDGTYTLALATSHNGVRGWVSTTGVVDTVAPTISGPTSVAGTFYPYPDHYQDVLRPRVTLGGAGTLTLEVVDASGRLIRHLVGQHGAGAATATWNGTDATGHRVPAGRYRYRLTITDAAGNSRSTTARQVIVSAARLHHRTITVTSKAAAYRGSGASASCSRLSTSRSAYRDGVLLTNACAAEDDDIAYAQYMFTVPSVVRYDSLAIGVYGRAGPGPAELTTSLRGKGGLFEVPAYLTVRPGRPAWHTVASVAARDHITGHHHVYTSLVLTSRYAGTNSFDATRIRLRLGAVVLY